MVQIVLILPGSTAFDLEHRIQGNLEIPLSGEGATEVAKIIDEIRARKLKIDTVYCTSCQHVQQTAETVAEALGVRLRKLDRMPNLNQGLWQGMLVEDVRLKQPKVYRQWQDHPEYVCAPEGETLSQAAERVETAMAKLLKRHKEGVIALVIPEPLASLARRYITHGELGDLWKAGAAHGHWELLEVAPQPAVQATGS